MRKIILGENTIFFDQHNQMRKIWEDIFFLRFFFYHVWKINNQFFWSAKIWKRISGKFSFMCETKWIKCQEEKQKCSWKLEQKIPGILDETKLKKKNVMGEKTKKSMCETKWFFPWSYFFLFEIWMKKIIICRERKSFFIVKMWNEFHVNFFSCPKPNEKIADHDWKHW